MKYKCVNCGKKVTEPSRYYHFAICYSKVENKPHLPSDGFIQVLQ